MSLRRYRHDRPPEGATLDVAPYGTCVVLEHTDPSIIRLRTTSGTEVKIGERALHLALLATPKHEAP